jgi:hypothetical protein
LSMKLQTRLARLEQRIVVSRGCPACQERRGVIAVTESRRLPDGTTVPRGDWPAPCTLCGMVPEIIVEVVRPLLAEEASRASSTLAHVASGRAQATQIPPLRNWRRRRSVLGKPTRPSRCQRDPRHRLRSRGFAHVALVRLHPELRIGVFRPADWMLRSM